MMIYHIHQRKNVYHILCKSKEFCLINTKLLFSRAFNVKPTLISSNICYLSQIPTEMRDFILLKLSRKSLFSSYLIKLIFYI